MLVSKGSTYLKIVLDRNDIGIAFGFGRIVGGSRCGSRRGSRCDSLITWSSHDRESKLRTTMLAGGRDRLSNNRLEAGKAMRGVAGTAGYRTV